MAVQVLTNLFVVVIVYNVTQRERDTQEEEKQGQRMMIRLALLFRGSWRETTKTRDEKFQTSLRTPTHNKRGLLPRSSDPTIVSGPPRASFITKNSTNNSTIIYV